MQSHDNERFETVWDRSAVLIEEFSSNGRKLFTRHGYGHDMGTRRVATLNGH